jgi:putative N6-adenine-specific DNA methylase
MDKFTLIATARFELEMVMVVKNEIRALGFKDIKATDAKVEFSAYLNEILKANLWLRSADRVFLKMGEFKAVTFDELFEKSKALPWENFITKNGTVTINAKALKSTLMSDRSCQSIVKKAVVERLKQHYNLQWLDETGPVYTIQVSILKDIVVLALDTSGSGLHKRGYRKKAGEAPLKETLAAGLVSVAGKKKRY